MFVRFLSVFWTLNPLLTPIGESEEEEEKEEEACKKEVTRMKREPYLK